MRGLIVLIVIFVVIVGGAILLSRSVSEQPTKTIEVEVTPMRQPNKAVPRQAGRERTLRTLTLLLAGTLAGAAIAQSQPESILPPGFGDPPPPAPPAQPPATTPAPGPQRPRPGRRHRSARERPTCRGSRTSLPAKGWIPTSRRRSRRRSNIATTAAAIPRWPG